MPLRRHILMIDANTFHWQLLRETLNEHSLPYVITRAPNLKKAFELLKGRSFDLVLTENILDPLYEDWIEKLKQDSRGAPLIINTIYNDQKLAVNAMKKGADDYIVKSRDSLKTLPGLITQFLAKKKGRRLTVGSSKKGSFDLLAKNLRTLADLVSQPSKGIAMGKRQLQSLNQEMENIKGIVKSWMS